MARDFVAITVAGLSPCDPLQLPGMQLTARQQQALHAALRRAPSPAHALRLVRHLQQPHQLGFLFEQVEHLAQVAHVAVELGEGEFGSFEQRASR